MKPFQGGVKSRGNPGIFPWKIRGFPCEIAMIIASLRPVERESQWLDPFQRSPKRNIPTVKTCSHHHKNMVKFRKMSKRLGWPPRGVLLFFRYGRGLVESLASLLHGMRRVVWLPSVLAALDGGFRTTNWCFLDFRREMAHKMIDGPYALEFVHIRIYQTYRCHL